MEQVHYFLKELLSFEYNVSQSQYIRRFLTPTQEDLEPKQPLPRRKKNGRRRSSNFTQTVRRFQKFGKTKIFGNKISSPIVLEHFVVMDDYKKQAKSDISLKKGKTVDVIEKRECGWWLVESEGEVGWAPALYLEPADEMSEVSNVQKFAIGRGEIYVTAKRYVAVEDDELSFEIGVNLQILEKNYDGWWKASYIGREGWVPAMYLKKLGNEQARSWRRKSRLFSTNELRDAVDEDDDEVFHEIPDEENTEKDKKVTFTRKISHQVMSAIGRKTSRNEENLRQNSNDAEDGGDDETAEGDRTTVEMSTVFLQLHKKESNPPQETPEKSQTLPAQRSPKPGLERKAVSALVASSFNPQSSTLPAQKSPRPGLERKSVSSLVASTFNPHSEGERSKDDMSLGISHSRSLDSIPKNAKYSSSLEAKWTPEIKNTVSSALKSVIEGPESDQDEPKNNKDPSPHPNGMLNDLSRPNESSTCEDEKDYASSQNESNSLNDAESLDQRSESTSSTELAQSPDVVMEEPVDLARHFKTISIGGDSPRVDSPKRAPPVPSLRTQNLLDELRSRSPAPTRNPPVPNGISTFPRRANAKIEAHEDGRNPQSIDRKIIRQSSIETETEGELNSEIQIWSSSEESEPELTQLTFNKVFHHPKSGNPPVMEVDETEDMKKNGEEESGTDFNEEGPLEEEDLDDYSNEDDTDYLNDSINSTESLEIVITEPPEEDESTDIYCAFDDCEVDNEMYLSKGDYVKVLERASTGWWLVRNEEGLKGWAPSNYLCPAPQVKGKTECLVPTVEGKCSLEEECRPEMSCRIIEDYRGDPYNQEVDLRRGEFAHVLHKSESGWWCVQVEDGEIGWAPSNYLEVFEDEDDHEYIIPVGN